LKYKVKKGVRSVKNGLGGSGERKGQAHVSGTLTWGNLSGRGWGFGVGRGGGIKGKAHKQRGRPPRRAYPVPGVGRALQIAHLRFLTTRHPSRGKGKEPKKELELGLNTQRQDQFARRGNAGEVSSSVDRGRADENRQR